MIETIKLCCSLFCSLIRLLQLHIPFFGSFQHLSKSVVNKKSVWEALIVYPLYSLYTPYVVNSTMSQQQNLQLSLLLFPLWYTAIMRRRKSLLYLTCGVVSTGCLQLTCKYWYIPVFLSHRLYTRKSFFINFSTLKHFWTLINLVKI